MEKNINKIDSRDKRDSSTHRSESAGVLANGSAAAHEGHQEDDASQDQDDDGHAVGSEGFVELGIVLDGRHHNGAECDE